MVGWNTKSRMELSAPLTVVVTSAWDSLINMMATSVWTIYTVQKFGANETLKTEKRGLFCGGLPLLVAMSLKLSAPRWNSRRGAPVELAGICNRGLKWYSGYRKREQVSFFFQPQSLFNI